MRWRVRSLGALLTVLVAAVTVVACGGGQGGGKGEAGQGQGQGSAAQQGAGQGCGGQAVPGQSGGGCEAGPGQGGRGSGPEQGRGGSSQGEGFNGTDIAWVQLMIAMNEQVLPLLDLTTGELRTPAMTVRAGHVDELTRLKALRKQAGLSEANPHAGHVMPGLVTEEDVRASATDKTRLVSEVIEHLEQRILLAKGVSSSGTSKGVKSLAQAIEQASIDALASWRALSMEWVPSVHPSKEI